MRVLFIGNSHTYMNDMPQIFKEICEKCGIKTEITMLARGGVGWDFHVAEPETRFNILYGKYDAVILQHVAHPMGDLDIMKVAGEKLICLTREAGARPVLYMTWTAKEDGPDRQPEMSKVYRKLGADNCCEVAPVGDVWWKFHEMEPDIELYGEDGYHASLIGSKIAAFTLACVVLNKAPLELSNEDHDVCDVVMGRAFEEIWMKRQEKNGIL